MNVDDFYDIAHKYYKTFENNECIVGDEAQQKISLVVSENLVIFINSMGEISALDNKNGDLIWQTTTQNNLLAENSFKIKNSDLILYKDSLYFSNSKSNFFSIGLNNGVINWKQNIDSNLRPTAIDNLML